MQYDKTVIIRYAGLLYSQAHRIIVFSTIGGIITGILIAVFGYDFLEMKKDTQVFIGLFTVLITGVLGYFRGHDKAFRLKLEAQLALCQVAIEENTSRVAAAADVSLSAQPSTSRPDIKPAPITTTRPDPSVGKPWICKKCGERNPANAFDCKSCGTYQ